jgi:hypothetical protein
MVVQSEEMNLAPFPRRECPASERPIEFLPNFTKAIGGPNFCSKRDDLLGLTSGGYKTRKLEFLVAEAFQREPTPSSPAGGAVESLPSDPVSGRHGKEFLSRALRFRHRIC